MPSLPPSSWTTTRMRPSRSGWAAIAVRERKPGTVGASESMAERFSRLRRVSMVKTPILRQFNWASGRESKRATARLNRSASEPPSDADFSRIARQVAASIERPSARSLKKRKASPASFPRPWRLARLRRSGTSARAGVQSAADQGRGEVGAGDHRATRQPASTAGPSAHVGREEQLLPDAAGPLSEQQRAGRRVEAFEAPHRADHKGDRLRDLRVQVPRGEEPLRAEDHLDGPADVQAVGSQPLGQLRDGRLVSDVLAQERLAQPPRQPTRRGRLLEQQVRDLVAVEAVGFSQDGLGRIVVPVRADGISALDDRPAGQRPREPPSRRARRTGRRRA